MFALVISGVLYVCSGYFRSSVCSLWLFQEFCMFALVISGVLYVRSGWFVDRFLSADVFLYNCVVGGHQKNGGNYIVIKLV